jgi:hypothetical protein
MEAVFFMVHSHFRWLCLFGSSTPHAAVCSSLQGRALVPSCTGIRSRNTTLRQRSCSGAFTPTGSHEAPTMAAPTPRPAQPPRTPPPRHDPGAASTDGREAARWLHRGGPRRGGGGQPRGARARWIRGRCPRASAEVGSAVYAHDRAVSAAAAAGPASSSGTTAMAKAAAASEGAGRAEGAAEGMRRTPESRSEKRAAHAARNCSTIGRQEPGINPAGKLAPYAAAEGGGGGRPSKPGGLPLRLQGVARDVRGGGQQRR